MRNKLWLFLLFTLVSFIPLWGQNTDKIVILSSRVGAVVDKAEQQQFKIFEKIINFKSAVVYVNAAGEYYITFSILDERSGIRDTSIQYSLQSINMISEKIDHYESIINGTYKPGSEKAVLKYITRAEAAKELSETQNDKDTASLAFKQNAYKDNLGLSDTIALPDFYLYPSWGFGFGVSSFYPDLQSVYHAMTAIENKYTAFGYQIRPHDENSFRIGFLNGHINCRFSRNFGLLLNCAISVVKDIDYRSAILTVEYSPDIFFYKKFNLFCAAGVSNTFLNYTQNYGNTITPVKNDTYTTLESVSLNCSKYGFVAGLGIAYNAESVRLAFSSNYQFTSTSETSLYSSFYTTMIEKTRLGLSSLILSARITFFL